jgi:hypothetical protein
VLAFQLESEVVGQVAALVVTTEQPQGVGIVNLERPQIQNALDAEVSSVDVITQEKVASLGWVATDLEQLHQIVVLAVNIATYGNGGVHLQKVGLGPQNFGAFSKNP